MTKQEVSNVPEKAKTLSETAFDLFGQFYADNFHEGETLTGLVFGADDPTDPQFLEPITGLDRERIFDMWMVSRYRADLGQRAAPGYRKLKLLAELAQFSTLADTLTAEGIFISDEADR